MQGTFRWKAILVSVLAVALLGTGWYFLHRYQKRKIHGYFLELATRDEEGKRLDRAARFLRQYLLVQPDDVEALARYGKLLEKQAQNRRDLAEALRVFETLLAKDDKRDDIRLRAGKLCMALRNWDGAVDHLNALIATGTSNAEVEHLLGECEVVRYRLANNDDRGRHLSAAKKHLEAAVELAPKNLDAAGSLARLYLAMNEPAEATKVLNNLVKNNESDEKAFRIRAEIRQASNYYFDDPLFLIATNAVGTANEIRSLNSVAFATAFPVLMTASADLARARGLAPDKVDVLLSSAQQEMLAAQAKEPKLRNTNLEMARGYLGKAEELDPKDLRILPRLAALELVAGRRDVAMEHLRKAEVKANKRDERNRLLWELAKLLVEDRDWPGHKKEAGELLEKLRKGGEEPGRVGFLAGRMLMRDEEWSKAVEYLETARGLLLDNSNMVNQIHLLLAHCYERLGDTDRQLAAYQRAVRDDSQNAMSRLGVARTYAILGKTNEAIEECRLIRAMPRPFIDADVLYVRLLIIKNMTEAKENRRWEQAEFAIKGMEAAYGNKGPEVLMAHAELEYAKGNVDEAKRIIAEDVLDRHGKAAKDKASLHAGGPEGGERIPRIAWNGPGPL
jgi:tetratricopeptide (TPR) repeat protein